MARAASAVDGVPSRVLRGFECASAIPSWSAVRCIAARIRLPSPVSCPRGTLGTDPSAVIVGITPATTPIFARLITPYASYGNLSHGETPAGLGATGLERPDDLLPLRIKSRSAWRSAGPRSSMRLMQTALVQSAVRPVATSDEFDSNLAPELGASGWGARAREPVRADAPQIWQPSYELEARGEHAASPESPKTSVA